MNSRLQAEIARRKEAGAERITFKELKERIEALGYKLDRSMTCTCQARNLTGPGAGESYPCRTYGINEADTGVSAFHYQDARRDDNFAALQKLRRCEDWYCVSGGYLVEP